MEENKKDTKEKESEDAKAISNVADFVFIQSDGNRSRKEVEDEIEDAYKKLMLKIDEKLKYITQLNLDPAVFNNLASKIKGNARKNFFNSVLDFNIDEIDVLINNIAIDAINPVIALEHDEDAPIEIKDNSYETYLEKHFSEDVKSNIFEKEIEQEFLEIQKDFENELKYDKSYFANTDYAKKEDEIDENLDELGEHINDLSEKVKNGDESYKAELILLEESVMLTTNYNNNKNSQKKCNLLFVMAELSTLDSEFAKNQIKEMADLLNMPNLYTSDVNGNIEINKKQLLEEASRENVINGSNTPITEKALKRNIDYKVEKFSKERKLEGKESDNLRKELKKSHFRNNFKDLLKRSNKGEFINVKEMGEMIGYDLEFSIEFLQELEEKFNKYSHVDTENTRRYYNFLKKCQSTAEKLTTIRTMSDVRAALEESESKIVDKDFEATKEYLVVNSACNFFNTHKNKNLSDLEKGNALLIMAQVGLTNFKEKDRLIAEMAKRYQIEDVVTKDDNGNLKTNVNEIVYKLNSTLGKNNENYVPMISSEIRNGMNKMTQNDLEKTVGKIVRSNNEKMILNSFEKIMDDSEKEIGLLRRSVSDMIGIDLELAKEIFDEKSNNVNDKTSDKEKEVLDIVHSIINSKMKLKKEFEEKNKKTNYSGFPSAKNADISTFNDSNEFIKGSEKNNVDEEHEIDKQVGHDEGR